MATFNPVPISTLTALSTPTANDLVPVFDPEEAVVANKTKAIKYSDFIPLGLELLADPNATRLLYWNDSNNSLAWLSLPADMSVADGVIVQKHMMYNTIIPVGTTISAKLSKMIIPPELNGCKLANLHLATYSNATSAVNVSVKRNGSTVAGSASISSGAKTGTGTGTATVFSTNQEVWIDCTSGTGGDGLDVVLVFQK